MSDESHLPLVTVFDTDIIVPPTNVELDEVVSVFQLIYKVRDERERIGIMSGMFIEVLVVLAGMEFSILLFDKEERRGLGGV